MRNEVVEGGDKRGRMCLLTLNSYTRGPLTQFSCYKPQREAIQLTVYESRERTRIMTRHTEYRRSVSYQKFYEDPLKWGGKWIGSNVIYGLYMMLLLVLFIVYYEVVRPWFEQ